MDIAALFPYLFLSFFLLAGCISIRDWFRRRFKTPREKKAPAKRPRFSPEYRAYMGSDAWAAKRWQRLTIDGFRCQHCHSRVGLQVHHLSYKHLGHEPMSDLVTLCHACHQRVHGRRF